MADTVIAASLTLTADQANQVMKDFKQELKTANAELLVMEQKFGATSVEAQNAAKKVAELRDRVDDNKKLIDAFNPDRKFNAFAGSIQAVTGGFAALQGVMGLLGTESEELQKSLLKVQSALAISQGVDSIRDAAASVKTLGAQLVQNLGKGGLIGIAIAGVAALAAVLLRTKDEISKTELANEQLNKSFKSTEYINAVKNIESLRINIDLAKKGIIDKKIVVDQYNTSIGTVTGSVKSLDEAEKALVKNADAYIKYTLLKAAANAALEEAAKLAVEIEKRRLTTVIRTDDAFKNATQDQLDEFKKLGEQYDEAFFAGDKKRADTIKAQREDILNSLKDNAVSGELKNQLKTFEDIAKDFTRRQQEVANQFGFKPTVETPRTANVAKENKEIEYQYSTHGDNLLLIEEENRKKIADGRNIFILEGMRLEEEDFNEKIKFLNLELDAEENATRKKIALTEAERAARIQTAQDVGMALGALADLVGKQTAAGKVLAVAQATINTWLGVTEVLKTKSLLPEPLATISRIANIATVLASGFNAVKNIVKTQVPGGGGGSAPVASSPLTPQAQLSTTQLDQGSLNQLGNSTVRAYVVESDVQNNSERVRRLNRASRIS